MEDGKYPILMGALLAGAVFMMPGSIGTAQALAPGQSITITCDGVSQPTPTPAPTPPAPIVTMPSATPCNTGMLAADKTWSPMLSNVFPIPPTGATGDTGRAIQFAADGVRYPNGIKLKTIDESGAGTLKEIVVSACPHNFVPASPGCRKAGGTGFFHFLHYSTSSEPPQAYDCPLVAGRIYYINFRALNVPRGTAYSQFSAEAR